MVGRSVVITNESVKNAKNNIFLRSTFISVTAYVLLHTLTCVSVKQYKAILMAIENRRTFICFSSERKKRVHKTPL